MLEVRKRDDLIDLTTWDRQYSFQIKKDGGKWAYPISNGEMCVYKSEADRNAAMSDVKLRGQNVNTAMEQENG